MRWYTDYAGRTVVDHGMGGFIGLGAPKPPVEYKQGTVPTSAPKCDGGGAAKDNKDGSWSCCWLSSDPKSPSGLAINCSVCEGVKDGMCVESQSAPKPIRQSTISAPTAPARQTQRNVPLPAPSPSPSTCASYYGMNYDTIGRRCVPLPPGQTPNYYIG